MMRRLFYWFALGDDQGNRILDFLPCAQRCKRPCDQMKGPAGPILAPAALNVFGPADMLVGFCLAGWHRRRTEW